MAIPLVIAGAASAEETNPPRGSAPTITLTTLPVAGAGADSWGQIAGKTTGANPDEQRVVLYALTDQWYVQPLIAQPFTKIAKDGSFQSGTHLGGTYAALLVDRSFVPPPTLAALPPVGDGVIAEVQAPAR
jgi:hypothetical protein